MNLHFRSAQSIRGARDYASARQPTAEQIADEPVVEWATQTDVPAPGSVGLTQTTHGYPVTPIPLHDLCRECRFGAGQPVGPQQLMRCVHPGELTAGQFLRGPIGCEGFEARPAVAQRAERERVGIATVTQAEHCGR
jgi:hypothetical protein